MSPLNIDIARLMPELEWTSSRSSGPGGQNVNKVETRISLRFDLQGSILLTEEEKNLLLKKWATKLTKEGVLIIHAEEHRSQLKNKALTIEKLSALLKKACYVAKPRKATKPSKGAIRERLEGKKKNSEKKAMRKRPE